MPISRFACRLSLRLLTFIYTWSLRIWMASTALVVIFPLLSSNNLIFQDPDPCIIHLNHVVYAAAHFSQTIEVYNVLLSPRDAPLEALLIMKLGHFQGGNLHSSSTSFPPQ
jgi:hypothetical protein